MLRVHFQLPDQLPIMAEVGRIPVTGDFVSFDKSSAMYQVELVQLIAHTRPLGRQADAVIILK